MIDCELFFHPMRDPANGEAVLMPVLVSEDGQTRLFANKVVTTAEKALSMYSGFALALTVDEAGCIEDLQQLVSEEKGEDEEDVIHQTEAQ